MMAMGKLAGAELLSFVHIVIRSGERHLASATIVKGNSANPIGSVLLVLICISNCGTSNIFGIKSSEHNTEMCAAIRY